jgi:CRP/FNR family cyclic AMP-dependent transcriptional regulator
MARQNYLDHLAQVPLFSACSKKELTLIARAGDEATIEKGRVITEQGGAAREAFIIIDGEATVIRNGQKVATLVPGAAVGELALLDRGPRTATVEAATDLTLFVLGPREFAALLDEVPTLAHKLMQAMAAKIRELDTQIYG